MRYEIHPQGEKHADIASCSVALAAPHCLWLTSNLGPIKHWRCGGKIQGKGKGLALKASAAQLPVLYRSTVDELCGGKFTSLRDFHCALGAGIANRRDVTTAAAARRNTCKIQVLHSRLKRTAHSRLHASRHHKLMEHNATEAQNGIFTFMIGI